MAEDRNQGQEAQTQAAAGQEGPEQGLEAVQGEAPEDDAVTAEIDKFLEELEVADFEEMEPMEEEIPEQFAAFVASLAVNKDGQVEGLEPPGSEQALVEAERSLGYSLPEVFRSFLTLCNGGSVHDICLCGVGTGDEYDLVTLNDALHSQGLPSTYVAFAVTPVGNLLCFKKDQAKAQDSAIYLYDSETREAFPAYSSFSAWLEAIPRLQGELEQSPQPEPQPMTIEEWEAFVSRERQKLRKLSKTPARELSMPDPEAIRAELNNKIPVDPRHLKQN